MLELLPGPEFDSYGACQTASHDVDHAARATKDLGVSGHSGFQQKGVIVDLCGDQDGPRGAVVADAA